MRKATIMFSTTTQKKSPGGGHGAKGERGGALAIAMIVLALIAVIAVSVLATVTNEARISGSDLRRTRACYAASAKIEVMTSGFSALFSHTTHPSSTDLDTVRTTNPPELVADLALNGMSLTNPVLGEDTIKLQALQAAKGIVDPTIYPSITIPSGPFAGLSATIDPYKLQSTAQYTSAGNQCVIERDVNNYLIPLFQFGMFSDKDIELHPGPAFTFNGRVHANGNIYVAGNVKFLDKVTTANEIVTDLLRNGNTKSGNTVSMQVGLINVPLTKGSVNNGPNFTGASQGQRGYFPGSPNGTANTSWESTSVAAATAGVNNQFGGQLQTRTTGAAPLLLPMQLDGNPTREIIKRMLPTDSTILNQSRYHSKAEVRILLDDASVPAGAPGSIPLDAGGNKKGVDLATWVPSRIGRKVLHRFDDAGTDLGGDIQQANTSGSGSKVADAVRGANALASCGSGVTAAVCSTSTVAAIPSGAALSGRIYIEIVPPSTTANPSPTPIDVTQTVLSMGITEGEPNAIVMLQRPLWASFTQGDRDADGGNDYLTYLFNSTAVGADGEILIDSTHPQVNATYGYLTNIQDDGGSTRSKAPPALPGPTPAYPLADPNSWNAIVPIDMYNVREGRITTSLDGNTIYSRGVVSVVEINMKNFARWVDGVYDANLLSSTTAVSTNIGGPDGYILYVSDRRGDRVKGETIGGTVYNMTNGLVDNEDIYGPNGTLDPGEDVIDAGADGSGNPKQGTLQKDTAELPDPTPIPGGTPATTFNSRIARALAVAAYNPIPYFRRAVRLVNGDTLKTSMTGTNKLSQTRGITVATENMLYVWGNYNTTGINNVPTGGASLAPDYNGPQVPASLICDALFPLSKTWFDSSSAIYPDDLSKRLGDLTLDSTGAVATVLMGSETSVRAAVIAGNNMSALAGSPDAGNANGESRLSGGIHNFPRFSEQWSARWNFLGSLVPLYYSTQAVGPYNADSTIYSPPVRNWAFDDSFKDPSRLPPGTPMFQYIEPTGFTQVMY